MTEEKNYTFSVNFTGSKEGAMDFWNSIRLGNEGTSGLLSDIKLVDSDTGELLCHMPLSQQKDWEEVTGEAMLGMMRADSELIMNRAKPSEFWRDTK